jgi:hypothetical protein
VPRPAIPVLAGLIAGILFVTANVWALHDPQPHNAPVAVSGANARALARDLGPGFRVIEATSARAAVESRDAYFGFTADGQMYYAGANGRAVNDPQLVSNGTDVVALAKGDPNGNALAQVVLGTIIGGFLTGVLMAQLALGSPLWQRGLAYVAFALTFGLLGATVASGFSVVPPGSFFVVWVWMAATACTISVGVGAFARAAGQAGIPLAMLCFLIIGNPSSGATVVTDYQPWLFRTLGPYLPPNALASGVVGTTYFDANVLRPLLVLGGWLLAGALALAVLDRSRGSRRALAYDAAEAADEREDRAA